MEETERLSALIGDIYDAAIDPARWLQALEGSARYVGGSASALFLKDSVYKRHNNIHTWGYDLEYTRIYLEKYGRFDPFATAQFFFDIEEPISLADIVPHSEFENSLFYKEWVSPQRWIDAIAVSLEKSATTYVAFSVIRHENDGIADEPARQRMKRLAPHVRRAVAIGKVIDLHKIEAATFADTLDGLGAAMILVDVAGRIVHANAAGHAMLMEGAVATAPASKFTAIDANANRALQDVFATAGGGDTAVGTGGIAIPLCSCDGERYVAHVLPLTSGARRQVHVAYRAIAAVFIRKVGLETRHPLELLASTYQLTPAEMRVLAMIVEIGGVPEVAPVLGVSETTVKTHLQHIFAKTETARQADLVKLVSSYMGPFGGPPASTLPTTAGPPP